LSLGQAFWFWWFCVLAFLAPVWGSKDTKSDTFCDFTTGHFCRPIKNRPEIKFQVGFSGGGGDGISFFENWFSAWLLTCEVAF
jgi:hypothetical protein